MVDYSTSIQNKWSVSKNKITSSKFITHLEEIGYKYTLIYFPHEGTL